MLQLTTKCWNSAFHAQGSRLIIVVVQVRGVKIYVGAVEALKKIERQDETQFTTKIDGFLSFPTPWMLMYCFAGLKKNLTCMTSRFWCCVCLTLRITRIYGKKVKNESFGSKGHGRFGEMWKKLDVSILI
jgi:hypothetical protein